MNKRWIRALGAGLVGLAALAAGVTGVGLFLAQQKMRRHVDVPVQPVALRYGPRGDAQHVVAFTPRESFFANFVRLLGEPPRATAVCFLQPIFPGEAEGRRQIAELARSRIAEAMRQE